METVKKENSHRYYIDFISINDRLGKGKNPNSKNNLVPFKNASKSTEKTFKNNRNTRKFGGHLSREVKHHKRQKTSDRFALYNQTGFY
jgi:hypothetical protein